MAISGGVNLASFNEKVSNTQTVITLAIAAAINDLVLVSIAKDNTSTVDGDNAEVTSVTDSKGNTYAKAKEFTNAQTGSATGATASVWFSKITTALAVGDTVTINYVSANTAKAGKITRFTADLANSTIAVQNSAGLADDASDPGSMTLSGLPSQEYLFWRVIASETNDTSVITKTINFTSIGLDITSGGAVVSNMRFSGEFRILTDTASTSDPTFINVDHASVFIAFKEVPPVVTEDIVNYNKSNLIQRQVFNRNIQ